MNGTIARLTASGLLRKWRGVLLMVLPLLMLGVTIFIKLITQGIESNPAGDILSLNLGTVVPLIVLIIGTGAISTEIDDGSIVYLLTKPIRRSQIILTKLAVAIAASLVFTVIPTIAAGVVVYEGFNAAVMAHVVAVAIACVAYSALFLLLGVLSRHAVMIGLMYILIWENLVSGLVSGARVLGVQYWSSSIAAEISSTAFPAPDVKVLVAVILAIVLTVGTTALASDRLRSLKLTGESS